MTADSRFMRNLTKILIIVAILLLIFVTTALILDKFIVYDEETSVATLLFFNVEEAIPQDLYSVIQILSALPLATIIIITISILGLYVKLNIEQTKNKKNIDKFMTLMSKKAQVDCLVSQKTISGNLFFSDLEQTTYKQEYNSLIAGFDEFSKENLEPTKLSIEDYLNIKKATLTEYTKLKDFFEKRSLIIK